MKVTRSLETECCLCHKPLHHARPAATSISGFPICVRCLGRLEGYSRKVIVAKVHGEERADVK